MTGLNEEITISFLLAGHTKFAPDWGFGLFKRLFKRTAIGTIHDITDVVKKSATVNHPQLIGDYNFCGIFDWSRMFEQHTTAIKGISRYHHFRVASSDPGIVHVSTGNNDPVNKINILRESWVPSRSTMPPLIVPPGLPLERQWYLYNKIREFCPDEVKDIVCPLPSHPL